GGWSKIRSASIAIRSAQKPVDQCGQDTTEYRPQHRNPGIGPIASILALDGQKPVHDPRPKITGRVNGITGGPPQGKTDDENQKGHWNRAQRPHSYGGLGTTIAQNRIAYVKNDKNQGKGPNDLTQKVGRPIPDGR